MGNSSDTICQEPKKRGRSTPFRVLDGECASVEGETVPGTIPWVMTELSGRIGGEF